MITIPGKMMELDLNTQMEFHEESKFLRIMTLSNVKPQDIKDSLDLDIN